MIHKNKQIKYERGFIMNIIERNYSGCYSMRLSKETVKELNSYKPKGCPFNEYTLLDLLQDWFKAYSWELSDKITTIENFIKMIQNNGESKALVYGNDMINIINT